MRYNRFILVENHESTLHIIKPELACSPQPQHQWQTNGLTSRRPACQAVPPRCLSCCWLGSSFLLRSEKRCRETDATGGGVELKARCFAGCGGGIHTDSVSPNETARWLIVRRDEYVRKRPPLFRGETRGRVSERVLMAVICNLHIVSEPRVRSLMIEVPFLPRLLYLALLRSCASVLPDVLTVVLGLCAGSPVLVSVFYDCNCVASFRPTAWLDTPYILTHAR